MIDEFCNHIKYYQNMQECYYAKLVLKKYFTEKYLKEMNHVISSILQFIKYDI